LFSPVEAAAVGAGLVIIFGLFMPDAEPSKLSVEAPRAIPS
jgi:hypothetical protein